MNVFRSVSIHGPPLSLLTRSLGLSLIHIIHSSRKVRHTRYLPLDKYIVTKCANLGQRTPTTRSKSERHHVSCLGVRDVWTRGRCDEGRVGLRRYSRGTNDGRTVSRRDRNRNRDYPNGRRRKEGRPGRHGTLGGRRTTYYPRVIHNRLINQVNLGRHWWCTGLRDTRCLLCPNHLCSL